MHVSAIGTQNYKNSFSSLCIYDKELQYSIWKNANKRQKELLNQMANEERENPVHAIIYSKYGFLRARLMCARFIAGFQEYHKQIPLFESRFSFIKRVTSVIHGYNERLKKAQLSENERK